MKIIQLGAFEVAGLSEKEKKIKEAECFCTKKMGKRAHKKKSKHQIYEPDHLGFFKVICSDCGKVSFTTNFEAFIEARG